MGFLTTWWMGSGWGGAKERERERSLITFYALSVEATHFINQGSHKGLLDFKERGNGPHLLWESSKVGEDHMAIFRQYA